MNKLNHQAPKGSRINLFNSVEIDGDFAYCASHNFVYNKEAEEEKLYNGLPCYFTDNRFFDGNNNYYKQCMLYWTRWYDVTLKSCIRKALSCKNIPAGTIIDFKKSWYHSNKKVNNSFRFKIKKENKLEIKFEINDPLFYENFSTCEFSQKLTDALRNNGFLVKVNKNNFNRISSLISTAGAKIGKDIPIEKEAGETAIAYGHGKKIGFSSNNDSFCGYSSGCDNVLWDFFGEFNKWSQCAQIPKTTSIDEIINILSKTNG